MLNLQYIEQDGMGRVDWWWEGKYNGKAVKVCGKCFERVNILRRRCVDCGMNWCGSCLEPSDNLTCRDCRGEV